MWEILFHSKKPGIQSLQRRFFTQNKFPLGVNAARHKEQPGSSGEK
jgi:hypothetical protein